MIANEKLPHIRAYALACTPEVVDARIAICVGALVEAKEGTVQSWEYALEFWQEVKAMQKEMGK